MINIILMYSLAIVLKALMNNTTASLLPISHQMIWSILNRQVILKMPAQVLMNQVCNHCSVGLSIISKISIFLILVCDGMGRLILVKTINMPTYRQELLHG